MCIRDSTRSLVRPRVVVGVPSGVTEVEKRAVIDATMQAGAREAYLIEEPMAAAIGAGLPVHEPTGNMVVDIGGGTTEIAVISLGGIVTSRSIRIGGDEMDASIVRYIKKQYNLMIGERTAEEIKINVGTAIVPMTEVNMDIRGRDLVSGLPKTLNIKSSEILVSYTHLDVYKRQAMYHSVLSQMSNLYKQAGTPLQRMEHRIHSLVSYFILPLFALANSCLLYTSIAAEIGLLGFMAFCSVLFGAMHMAFSKPQIRESQLLNGLMLGFGLALACIAVNGFTDYVLFNIELSMLFWIINAFIVIIHRERLD